MRIIDVWSKLMKLAITHLHIEHPKICKFDECSRSFPPTGRNQQFCSDSCRDKHRYRHKLGRRAMIKAGVRKFKKHNPDYFREYLKNYHRKD